MTVNDTQSADGTAAGTPAERPRRVLIVAPDRADPGGVANYYNAVMPHLQKDRVITEYLAIGSTRGRRNPFYVISDQLRVWRRIRVFDPDVVHLNPSLDLKSFIRDGLFMAVAKLQRRRVIVFFRGWQVPFADRVSARWLPFFRRTYGRADAFIVLAQQFREQLQQWGIEAPIHLGTTAVPDQLLDGFRIEAKMAALADSPRVKLLYLARLERDKGVLELLDAVAALLRDGLPVSLTIAGDGPVMGELRNRVVALGEHAQHVHLPGYVRGPDKARILKEHHLFCFPTRYGEGMPNALLEAMGFGMAVVTYPVGGIGDFFRQPEMGVLLTDTQPGTIATALASMIDGREGLGRAGRFNHAFAAEHFLASQAARFLMERYEQVGSTA